MGTTAEKLTYLDTTKDTLKTNLISKGITVPQNTTFRRMAEMVEEIEDSPNIEYVIVNNRSPVDVRIETTEDMFVVRAGLTNYSYYHDDSLTSLIKQLIVYNLQEGPSYSLNEVQFSIEGSNLVLNIR